MKLSIFLALILLVAYAQNDIQGPGNIVQNGKDNFIRGKLNSLNGYTNKILGNLNNIVGDSNQVKGNKNLIIGDDNLVFGVGNFVMGESNQVNDDESISESLNDELINDIQT